MKSKIYIRTDGSTQIGLGHLVRCIALAEMLKDDFLLFFASRQIPESTIDEITEAGFQFISISDENSLLSMLKPDDFVVIDSYQLDSEYQKAIKRIGCILICIDDLHEHATYADLILNHTPGVTPSAYDSQSYTQFALGPNYALLRPPFLNRENNVRKKSHTGSALICFGGADSKNLTKRALETIIEFDYFKKIAVVTGAAYASQNLLVEVNATHAAITFHHDIGAAQMALLMSESDVCIVPASGILSEALTTSAAVISGMYVENQRFVFENYKNIDAFISAENFSRESLRTALERYLKIADAPKSRLIDGKSGERISKIFRQMLKEKEFSLRKIQPADEETTFRWAIDKQVRMFSFNQTLISPEEHNIWYSSKISDVNCKYYIGEMGDKPIGSIRFDVRGKDAVVSYLLDPAFQNQGLGSILLKKGIVSFCNENSGAIQTIYGIVMRDNISSCKTFERFGFTKESEGENFRYTMNIGHENRKL